MGVVIINKERAMGVVSLVMKNGSKQFNFKMIFLQSIG